MSFKSALKIQSLLLGRALRVLRYHAGPYAGGQPRSMASLTIIEGRPE